MSRTLVTLFALLSILATGCGEVGFPHAPEVQPPPMFQGTSAQQHQAAVEGFTDVIGLGLADAAVVLDGAHDVSVQLDELAPLDVARVAAAMDAFTVPGNDLDAQVEYAIGHDRVLARPVELVGGPAVWLTWQGAHAAHGALFDVDSSVVRHAIRTTL